MMTLHYASVLPRTGLSKALICELGHCTKLVHVTVVLNYCCYIFNLITGDDES